MTGEWAKVALPYFLTQSKKCFVEIRPRVVDFAPDVVVCDSNGYIYEIKAKKIVNSLNLNEKSITSISYVYLFENEKIFLSYLVGTSTKKLYIIYSRNSRLEINKVYEQVEDFSVFDYKDLGYPQIKVHSKELGDTIVKFSINNAEAVTDEVEDETALTSLANTLEEKLQIVCRNTDELTEEWCSIRKLCQFNVTEENFGLLSADSVQFAIPLKKHDESITLTAKWFKVISRKLVLGIKFRNDGKEALHDIDFQIFEKFIEEYSFKFFSSCHQELQSMEDFLFFSEESISSIQPGQEMSVVGAVPLGSLKFPFRSKLQISCYLSSKFGNHLLKETFTVTIYDVVYCAMDFFKSLKDTCTVEDIQTIKTAKFESKLRVETKNATIDSMKNILKENLGFISVGKMRNCLYFSNSANFNEIFIAVRPVAVDDPVWKIILYTSDESDIYFIVAMLYELLPDYTTITLDED